MGSRVEVRNVGLNLGGSKGPQVFDGLTLAANAECVGVMGASGIGKTTLLRLISGHLPPDKGQVSVGGKDPKSVSGQIAYLPQSGGVFPWLRVSEHLRLSSNWDSQIAYDLVKRLKMEATLDAFAAKLSGGEKKRLALILTLLSAEDVMLLDEPLVGLDADLKQIAAEAILQHHKRKSLTTFLVSHSVEECVELCSRVLFLRGRPAKIHAGIDLASMRNLPVAQRILVLDKVLREAVA